MVDHYRLDESGEPVLEPDIIEWARWQMTNQAIARDAIDDPVTGWRAFVSTVFVGTDYNVEPGRDPKLWETRVFGGTHDESQWRYSSYDAAKAGHAKVVEWIKSGRTDELEEIR